MVLATIADLRRSTQEIEPLIKQARELADLYDRFIAQDNETYSYTVTDYGENTREPGIHGSEISKCQRRLVYGIMGTERRADPDSIKPNMKLRFRTGTAIHAMIQTDFKRMAAWYTRNHQHRGFMLTFEEELTVKPELQAVAQYWGIRSHCDGAFTFWWWDSVNGTWVPYLRVGLEIKTSSDAQFAKRRKPELDHTEQTCLYQACLDLPLMWVLYYNKSNSNYTNPSAPWLFKFDENLWRNELERRFQDSYARASSNQLPDRVVGLHCGWCPFKYTCRPPDANVRRFTPPLIPTSMLPRRT